MQNGLNAKLAGHLKTDTIKLLVLDEADQLFQMSFLESIEQIYSTLKFDLWDFNMYR